MPASETVTALPAISPAALLSLQRTAGNGAATRLLQRTKVNTNGGVFDNAPMYAPVNRTGAVGERIGANIMIDFTPGELVEAPVDGVVLTQTVKAVTDHKPGAAALRPTRDQDSFASSNADDKARFGPGGVGIDVPIHPGGRDEPSHNPIYGVGFGAEDTSTSLSGGTPTVGRTRRGSHVRNRLHRCARSARRRAHGRRPGARPRRRRPELRDDVRGRGSRHRRTDEGHVPRLDRVGMAVRRDGHGHPQAVRGARLGRSDGDLHDGGQDVERRDLPRSELLGGGARRRLSRASTCRSRRSAPARRRPST